MEKLEHYQPKRIPSEQQTAMISVVVPVYNVAEYLEKSVESILGQTYQNLEIILVEDGSADESLAICKNMRLWIPGSGCLGRIQTKGWAVRATAAWRWRPETI